MHRRAFPSLPGLGRARLLDSLAMNTSYLCKSIVSLLTSESQIDDYEHMARSVGNLYFAGEHTIGTHPATVHGAYLSGLRAA